MRNSLPSRAIRRTPLRWLVPNHVWRTEVITSAVNALAAKCYLEIGVDVGVSFAAVSAVRKVGVDPVAAQPLVVEELRKPGASYFPMTSDEFFREAAPQALHGGVDVAFVDGLHTADQAYRDCLNVLSYLAPGGVILVHDCLPNSEAEARVARDYAHAGELNGPGWSGDWTGDVWKAIVMLRARHTDLETFVLHSDFGVGVITRAPNRAPLKLTADEINAMTYADLIRDRRRLLGLRAPHEFFRTLDRLRAERALITP